MIEIAATDTHALIWYGNRQWKKLGPRARRVFEDAEAGHATIYVPVQGLVELSEGVRNGRAVLPTGFSDWVTQLFAGPMFFPAALTHEIVLRAEELYEIPERGDRLIAATAAHLGFPLITRDPEIARAAGVDVVW